MGTIVTSEITPRVFIADWFVAQNWDALNALGITHVVSVCEIPPLISSRIAHMHVCIVDLPIADISDHFEKTTKFMRDALATEGTKILVHCLGGLSRSVSVVCAYLIAAKGLTASEALAYAKNRRSIAHPNIGFRAQLRKWALVHGLPDSTGDDQVSPTIPHLGITSHLPQLPGSGLLQHGIVGKMVADSVGRLAGHGGSETDILHIARVKALGPDWVPGSTTTVVTHTTLNPDQSVNVDVAVAHA
ncbi:protein-tyrosine phosphatase-like protein [Roridomyces roridus]|uniref:Protein-tyrosine phosphatase-like protein n=1 Tax=Roridomyces roridus TaxID=1738132 RepID=A0AAD7C001_9AGAR|nr:protein-tyrosine phosphatase-like protein [Roridomyces roridus]